MAFYWRARNWFGPLNAAHPITRGVPPVFAIEAQEMYGELFDIPQPDELVFISALPAARFSAPAAAFTEGRDACSTFSPGDQEYPVYHHPVVRRVIANGVDWTYRDGGVLAAPCNLEKMREGWIEETWRNRLVSRAGELAACSACRRGRHGPSPGPAIANNADVALVGWTDLFTERVGGGIEAIGLSDVGVEQDIEPALAKWSPDFVVDVAVPEAHH